MHGVTLDPILQLMRRIRQSSKYKQRLKELLHERTQANLNGSPSKPRKAPLKPRKKGYALWLPCLFHVSVPCLRICSATCRDVLGYLKSWHAVEVLQCCHSIGQNLVFRQHGGRGNPWPSALSILLIASCGRLSRSALGNWSSQWRRCTVPHQEARCARRAHAVSLGV